MRRCYAHIFVGNWLILYTAELILVTPAFCLTFITRLVTLNGVRLSCLKMFFFLLVMMNLEIMFADGSGLELSHLNCFILNVATNRA